MFAIFTVNTEAGAALGFGFCLFLPPQLDNKVSKPWVDFQHKNCILLFFQDERARIETLGGCVTYMDCWRVNGTLAVSRAIGKISHQNWCSSD